MHFLKLTSTKETNKMIMAHDKDRKLNTSHDLI